MKYTNGRRILAMLVTLCLMLGMMPVFVSQMEVEANAVSGIDSLTCSGFISNSTARAYIDMMMRHYLNKYSILRNSLDNGESVVFMFEGGSDYYREEDSGYAANGLDIRDQAVVIVVKKDSSGKVYIDFNSENCSSIPSIPTNTNGEAYNGATTILDGIYPIFTVNHHGEYAALQVKVEEPVVNAPDKKALEQMGYYTPWDAPEGKFNFCNGINIHTRDGYYAGGDSETGGAWSEGCQLIGGERKAGNEFNGFMQSVTGISWNPYASQLKTFSSTDRDVGYYVVDRQLGLVNKSGTTKDSLRELYTENALQNITAWSTEQRSDANPDYLSQCTFYPSYCQVKITTETTINLYPHKAGTNESEKIEPAVVGTLYTVTGLYKNPSGQYWYQVKTASGKTGYLYGGRAKFNKYLEDVQFKNYSSPGAHVQGDAFYVKGTVSSTNTYLKDVTVYVYPGTNTSGEYALKSSDKINGKRYVLDGSKVDDNALFNELSLGNYNYVVRVSMEYSYASSGTAMVTASATKNLLEKNFSVVKAPCTTHSWGSWKTTTSATCTKEGTKTRTCSNCGAIESKTIAKVAHKYSYQVSKDPTTSATGTLKGTCSACSGTTTVTLPKLSSSNYTVTVVAKPACGKTGTNRYTWNTTTYGTFSFTATVPATGEHNWSYAVSKEPTKTAKGALLSTCSNCSGTVTITLPELNTHDYDTTMITYPTCGKTGTQIYVWKNTDCGTFSFTVTVAANGNHKYSSEVSKVPTKTATGTLKVACDVCGENVTITLPVLDTKDYTSVLVVPPSCGKTGTQHYTWNNTDYGTVSFTVTVAATGNHKYSYQVSKNPTTTAAGTLKGTCSNCSGTTNVTLPKLSSSDYTVAVVTKPTCAKTGTNRYTWNNTDYGTFSFTASVSATGKHSFQYQVGQEPTTTATGTLKGICSVCSGTNTITLPKLNSSDYTVTVVQKATCTTAGTNQYTWKTTGAGIFTFTETVAATGHNNESLNHIPTCTEPGYVTNTCLDCGYVTEIQYSPVLAHNYKSVVTLASCTKAGYTTHTCSGCGDSYVDSEVPALGHTKKTVSGYAATCTKAGKTNGVNCSVCGAVLTTQKTIPATGHNYQSKITKTPGCTSAGVKTFTCKNCGDAYTESLAATGHSYEPEETVNSTCTKPGYTVYTCSACGDTYQSNETAALGHTEETVEGYAPTCTKTGLTDGTRCSECGTVITAQKSIPATGHNYQSAITTSPGCESAGVKTFICKNCDDTYTESLTATGHSYEVGKTVGPTCTEEGYTTYTCSACGDSYVSDEVAALGHTEEAIPGYAATCTETGLTDGVKCSVCGETLTAQETISATGHSFENGFCTVCGEADPDYSKPVVQPTITMKYPSLSFEDVIILNIYYSATDLQDVVEMGLITYAEKPDTYGVENADHVIPGYGIEGNYYFSGTTGIAPKDIGDTIYFSVYAKLSDGTYTYAKMFGYSPTSYALNQLKNGSAEMRALAAAMLNYGAAAQKYFGYKTDALVNATMTEEQKALAAAYSDDMIASVTQASGTKLGSFVNTGAYSKRYPTISFEGAFCINYYFRPSKAVQGDVTMYLWNLEDYEAAETLTADNATKAVKMTLTGSGEYLGMVDGITAKDLDKAVYVTFCYNDGTTDQCGGVIGYTIGLYCKSQAAGTGTLAELAKACAVYGYYAKQLFA